MYWERAHIRDKNTDITIAAGDALHTGNEHRQGTSGDITITGGDALHTLNENRQGTCTETLQ